jgi:hypothetical protein
MTINTKTALILVSTLIIGVVVGMLAVRVVARYYFGPPPGLPISKHFADRFERLIDPVETQKDTVRAILESYGERFANMHDEHFTEMKTLMDSMHVDLSSFLTEEQVKRIEERMMHRGRFREGRPPHRRRFEQ